MESLLGEQKSFLSTVYTTGSSLSPGSIRRREIRYEMSQVQRMQFSN